MYICAIIYCSALPWYSVDRASFSSRLMKGRACRFVYIAVSSNHKEQSCLIYIHFTYIQSDLSLVLENGGGGLFWKRKHCLLGLGRLQHKGSDQHFLPIPCFSSFICSLKINLGSLDVSYHLFQLQEPLVLVKFDFPSEHR